MRPASIDFLALGSVVAAGSHVLPAVLNTVAGVLGAVWFAIQIWDRFAKKTPPPANEAVRQWHRDDYDGPNIP